MVIHSDSTKESEFYHWYIKKKTFKKKKQKKRTQKSPIGLGNNHRSHKELLATKNRHVCSFKTVYTYYSQLPFSMIISKRNYLEKMEMAQPLKSFIDKIIECPDTDLPQVLSSKSTWERPRGDLFHWINVLNKFDLVFAVYIKKYGLDEEYPKLTIMAPEDSNVLIACLQFTTLLFEHCSNRSIYNSSDRLYSLIMTADIDVALAALETCVALGERYVQTGSSKYSAPKAVKMKILQIAKVYPPPVPALFKPDSTAKEKEKDSDNNSDKERLLDHYSLLDTLTGKKYPSKWKSIYFQYFKEPTEEEQRSSKVQNNNKKKRKVAKDEASAPTGASKSNSTSTTSTTISTTVASPSAVGGLTAFALSEDVVKNSSLQEIFDRASATIPPHLWFSFSLHALTIKSFNNKSPRSMKLREKLLRLKCFATGFITCMCLTEFTSSRLFESQPYIFSFLVDLIHPENRKHITREIYYAAIKAMECISLKRSSFGNDLIRCLGGNVNHGILFQCIRAINKKVVNEDDDVWEREYIHFFNMLGNLIDLKTLVPRLTSGGLLTDLMSFFNIKTKYRWLTSAAIHLTNLLLSSSPESFDEFINQSGFQLLIDTIKYEIQFCLENPNYGGGPPTDATVYYKITFRQANYIRNLMKLVLQLIQSEAGDRLRNLFDSPLLGCFNTILTNPTLFGPLIISSIIDSVFYIIHNEPTAYSILNEAKVIDTILDNYDSLFMPSGDLLMLLAEVLGAICLNNDGLSKVIAKQSLEKFFQTFFQLELAKEMAKTDMSSNIGCSIDELGRHYPSLKPIIMKQIKRIVIELPKFANSKLPGVEIYNNATGPNLFLDTRDAIPKLESGSEIYNWDACDLAYLIDNACFFIGGVLQDSSWGDLAMKEIKYNEWASFITLSNAPFDYTTSNGLASLIGVLKFFDEEKRDYGLPCLLKILKEKLNSPEVEAFINYDDYSKSFFEQSETIAYLTDTLKQLNVINILMYTLTEIYINPGLMFHERYHQIGDMFGKDDGISMLAKFGLLLRRCMIEEIVIRTRLPDDMVKHTAPLIEGVNNTTEYPPLQFFIEEPTTTP